MSKQKILKNTVVNGEFYAAGDTVSADVAQHITNPKVLAQTSGDTAGDKPYAKRTVPELEAEIATRNEGRDDEAQVVAGGKAKADLVKALEADDEAQAAAGDGGGDGGSGNPDPAGD